MKIKNPMIIIILILFVCAVWIINIRFFANINKQKSQTNVLPTVSLFSVESLATADFNYQPVKRDPFNVFIDTGPKEPSMPLFFLRGVVLTDEGALALMELSDGNVYPMKKGEVYLGVTIKDITPREVIVKFRGRKQTFPILQ